MPDMFNRQPIHDRSTVHSGLSTSSREMNKSQLTLYQNSINKVNAEIRLKYLRSIKTFLPVSILCTTKE